MYFFWIVFQDIFNQDIKQVIIQVWGGKIGYQLIFDDRQKVKVAHSILKLDLWPVAGCAFWALVPLTF